MNAYYNRNFGRKANPFVKRSSIRGNSFAKSRSSFSLSKALDLLLNLIDMIVSLASNARVRIVAKAGAGFACVVGIIGVIGRIELGTLSLLSGIVTLALIIFLEFLLIREKR